MRVCSARGHRCSSLISPWRHHSVCWAGQHQANQDHQSAAGRHVLRTLGSCRKLQADRELTRSAHAALHPTQCPPVSHAAGLDRGSRSRGVGSGTRWTCSSLGVSAVPARSLQDDPSQSRPSHNRARARVPVPGWANPGVLIMPRSHSPRSTGARSWQCSFPWVIAPFQVVGAVVDEESPC